MTKEDMINALEEALVDQLGESYGFEIEWIPKKHCLLIYVQLHAQNTSTQMIVDVDAEEASDIIEFEDVIALNGGKHQLNADDYLAIIPFDRKQGMTRSELQALAETIKDCLDNGLSDLLDFLENEEEEFSLTFDMDHYQKRSAQGDQTRVAYPKF